MSGEQSGWLAGSASSSFGIPAGTPMGGYAARTGPSIGTHDPLTVSVLALAAGDDELVMVAVDVAAVDEALSRRIATAAGIDRSSLLLAASHTHSGPAGITAALHPASAGAIDHLLRGRFVALCSGLIDAARARRAPATVSIGRSTLAGLAANRNDPDGPYDPTVAVLSVRDEAGSPVAIAVHWACHPTILSAENRRISADFPGAMRRHLCEALGAPDLPVLYLNGAAADVSTRFTRKDQSRDEVERVGSALAEAAIEAIERAEPLLVHMAHAMAPARLTGWSQDQIASMLSVAGEPAMDTSRLSTTRAQGLAMLRSLAESPCRPRRKSLRLDAWKLGDLVLLAVPGELFAGLGMRIAGSGSLPTLVVGYAGGYGGYLPDEAAYADGTYEALASPFGPGSGELVAESARELLRTVSG